MDDKGNLYLGTENDLKRVNEKTGRLEPIKVMPKRIVGLTDEEFEKVKHMNRQERRKWLRQNKKL